jgi:uncharacterized protein
MGRDTSMEGWAGPVIRILSIDGGGMRGVIPARVLVELERLTNQPIASIFDVIAGTSTGGIIALGLTRPAGADGAPLAAREILELYLQRGDEIFPRVAVRGLRSRSTRRWLAQRLGSVVRPRRFGNARYTGTGLEAMLDELLGDVRLSAALTDVIVPAYDWKAGRSVVFRSREAREGSGLDPAMATLARATAAAPTYFPPLRYVTNGREMIMIDGGFVANNPASIAYYEALCLERLRGEDAAFILVSLGTGRPAEIAPTYEEIWSRNWLKLSMGMLGLAFDATTEVTDDLLRTIIGGRWRRGRYWRLQTDLLGVNLRFDDASERNLAGLLELGERLVTEKQKELNEIAQLLSGHDSRRPVLPVSSFESHSTPT